MSKINPNEKPRILAFCTGCGYCFLLCPQKAVLAREGAGYRISEDLCTVCGKCILACPVDAITHPPDFRTGQEYLEPGQKVHELVCSKRAVTGDAVKGRGEIYDAVVIGSGIGGLLAAAALTRVSKRIAVIERLNFIGGRFTHFNYEGIRVNTGACHTLPYGEKGPFAEMIEALDLPVKIKNTGGMGSLYVRGRQFRWKGIMEFLKPFSGRDKLALLKIILKVLLVEKAKPPGRSFGGWLETQTSSEMVRSFFDRMINFGCSIGIDDIDYEEMRKVIKNVCRSKAPGVIEGGCGFLVEKVVELIRSGGGSVMTETEAVEITTLNSSARGVKAVNRKSGETIDLTSGLIISDIGPEETYGLLGRSWSGPAGEPEGKQFETRGRAVGARPYSSSEQQKINLEERVVGEMLTKIPVLKETSGMCINLICDVSLLSHGSIMYCLDTERVAGIAQPTKFDPGLAPPGKHLIISCQMLNSDDVDREIKLGLDDLAAIFGDSFYRHCRVINTGVFKNSWPVNRAAQGRDHPPVLPVKGLYLVGDGCKAPGHVMVEGVAGRVKEVLAEIRH